MSKYIVDEDLAKPIPGAVECIDQLRKAGILVGCDTGYYEEDSLALNKVLEDKYGLKFDVVTNAEKVLEDLHRSWYMTACSKLMKSLRKLYLYSQ